MPRWHAIEAVVEPRRSELDGVCSVCRAASFGGQGFDRTKCRECYRAQNALATRNRRAGIYGVRIRYEEIRREVRVRRMAQARAWIVRHLGFEPTVEEIAERADRVPARSMR